MTALKRSLEFLLIKIVEGLLGLMPMASALAWGEKIGMVLRRVLPGRDRLVIGNLSASFPEKSAGEIRAIADGFWRNLGRVGVEFFRAPEIVPDPLGDEHVIVGLDVLRKAVEENRGVIVVSGHFCNWEINGILLNRLGQRLGRPFTAITRPMKNPHTQRWVSVRRSAGGMPTILHREAVRSSLRALRQGEVVGMLIDQNLYTGGVFVDFFGRPAATTPLPALLHSRTGAPIVFTWVERDGLRFRVNFERLNVPTEGDPTIAVTGFINRRLERLIREKPEWWFWIHNRWKRSGEAATRSAGEAR